VQKHILLTQGGHENLPPLVGKKGPQNYPIQKLKSDSSKLRISKQQPRNDSDNSRKESDSNAFRTFNRTILSNPPEFSIQDEDFVNKGSPANVERTLTHHSHPNYRPNIKKPGRPYQEGSFTDNNFYNNGEEPGNQYSNARSAFNMGAAKYPNGYQEKDEIAVRIRGKNNIVQTMKGSVGRTLEQKQRSESTENRAMKDINERLRKLAELEKYRENKMRIELEKLEEEKRKQEEEEMSKRIHEEKRRKYLQDQKRKLEDSQAQRESQRKDYEIRMMKEEFSKVKREKKKQESFTKKKEKINEYKQKKKEIEELLQQDEFEIVNKTSNEGTSKRSRGKGRSDDENNYSLSYPKQSKVSPRAISRPKQAHIKIGDGEEMLDKKMLDSLDVLEAKFPR